MSGTATKVVKRRPTEVHVDQGDYSLLSGGAVAVYGAASDDVEREEIAMGGR